MRRWEQLLLFVQIKQNFDAKCHDVNHLWILSDSYEVTGLGYASEGQIEQATTYISLEDNELLNRLVDSLTASNAQVVALVLIIPILQF